ncbi:MAG: MerR family transcriptional regulator [Ruminococcus sp.]|jgi:DNA-binding transcriptional MerR regulator
MIYTMMQVCRELNITYQTLKFYCNEGLVPGVKRDANNRRIFDENTVKWIKDLTCLKKCGFSIQEMKEYLNLCLEGESTISLRQEMLSRKREAALRKQSDPYFGISFMRSDGTPLPRLFR